MADLQNLKDLENLQMKNMKLQAGELQVGLFTAYQAAQHILLDGTTLKTLCSTFGLGDSDVSSNEEFMGKVYQVVKRGFHLYVCDWEDTDICAFHILPHPNNNFDLEGIFLPKREIDLLPKLGNHENWSSPQKLQIIYITWYLVHEMSHAIGAILHADGLIKTREAPVTYSAYNLSRYSRDFIGEDGETYIFGERGFYMESFLGGILHAVNQLGDEKKIEYLLLEIRGKHHRVDETQWSEFYQTNIVQTDNPFKPLKAQPTLEENVPIHRLKGRNNLNTSTRPLRNGIFIRRTHNYSQ